MLPASRPKAAGCEKITINLGHIDLMVQDGFYSNRTDFIRNQPERHADGDLEAARRRGDMLRINVLGLASIAPDVSPALARAAVASVKVRGALHASAAIKAALADRTQ